jgi:hypothetical protein
VRRKFDGRDMHSCHVQAFIRAIDNQLLRLAPIA